MQKTKNDAMSKLLTQKMIKQSRVKSMLYQKQNQIENQIVQIYSTVLTK
jgi:hypothetical protein